MATESEGRAKRRRAKGPPAEAAPAVPVGGTPHTPEPKATDGAAPPATAAERPRRALALGSTLLPAGLALVGIGPSDLGMGVTLAALLVLVYGVHSFGRLGPG